MKFNEFPNYSLFYEQRWKSTFLKLRINRGKLEEICHRARYEKHSSLFSELVIKNFEILHEAKKHAEICAVLDITVNRASIYKERVLRRLISEIRSLDQEWG